MASKGNLHLARSRSFIYASRLSRLSALHPEPPSLTPEKLPQSRQFTPTKSKAHLHDKIDSILKHNSHLLSENNKLVQLIRNKDNQLLILEDRIEALTGELNVSVNSLKVLELDKSKLLLQFRQQTSIKQREISQLLTHVDMLKSKLTSMESQHKIEVMNLRQGMLREYQLKFQNAKRAQISNAEVYQVQIQKLKELAESNNREYEARFHECSLVERQQEEQIRRLTLEIKHSQSMNQMGMQQEVMNYENRLSEIKREYTNKHEKEIASYEITLKRLRKQIAEKDLENNRLKFQLEHTQENNKAEYDFIQKEKIKSEIQMEKMELKSRELLKTQKIRIEEMARTEMENVRECSNNYLKTLQSENSKLLEINNLKSEQIVKLQSQILRLKQTNETELHSQQVLNRTLKTKIYEQETHNQQESEFLKVKMSQLHQNDISALISNYEKQIVSLCDKISQLQHFNRECRAKLHKELEEKTQLRKHYEVEISKIHNKNIELKLKIQANELEMRQNNEIMISKHSITSRGLIQEQEMSRKEMGKMDEDNRKLQELVTSKDQEIGALNEKIEKLGSGYEEQKRQKQRQIQGLKALNRELIESQRREKQFYQKQLRKRQEEFRKEKETLENQLSTLRSKTYESLLKQLEQLQRQKISLQSQIQREVKQKEMHIKSNASNKELHEILKLESSAAIQQQRSNAGHKMSLEESKRNKHFNEQLQSKSKEIEELKRRLLQKNEDLRQSQNRQKELEIRLQGLMDLLRLRTGLENRVLNVGMDNNLVKNKAELFKQ